MALDSIAYVFSSCPAFCPLPLYLQPSCAVPLCVPSQLHQHCSEHTMALTDDCRTLSQLQLSLPASSTMLVHSFRLLAIPFQSSQDMRVTAVSLQSVEQ